MNMAPVGAKAEAIIDDNRVFQINPAAAHIAITTYINIDIHATGTWMNMILYDCPI